MEKSAGWRRRFVAVGSVLAIGMTLLGMAGAPAQAAQVTQPGPNNYAGPDQCPKADFDFCTNDTSNVTQNSSGGQNVFVARNSGDTVTQTNTSGPNTATCNFDNAASEQTCTVTQTSTTGNNTVDSTMTATQVSGQINLAAVTQSAKQTLDVTQSSASGNNAVTATETIDQQATSLVDANTPVRHTQDSFDLAKLHQHSDSGNNSAIITLDRSQKSKATGGNTTENQDTAAVAGTCDAVTTSESYPLGNGNACVYQRANGANSTNFLKVRAHDVKRADATDLTMLDEDQQQGRDGQDEWLVMTDVQTPNNLAGTTVDLGAACDNQGPCTAPGTEDGITKDWDMKVSNNLMGQPVSGTRVQFDEIRVPQIGPLSPGFTTSSFFANLNGPLGTKQIGEQFAKGHADFNWNGRLALCETAGNAHQCAQVPFSGQDIDVSLDCRFNENKPCESKGITGTGTPITVNEGATFSGETATFTNTNTAETGFTAVIDWGDGSTSAGTVTTTAPGKFSVSGTHAWSDAGSYTVTTKLKKSGTVRAQTTSTATVNNVPLHATGKTLYSPSTSFSGVVASFTDENPLSDASDFTASIDWGDNSTSSGSVAKSGSTYNVSGSHNFANFGAYTLKIHIEDSAGGTADAESTLYTYKYLATGAFVIGANYNPDNVYFWGSQWAANNVPSAPASFKGFENSTNDSDKLPACGAGWTSSTGNSPPPAADVPADTYMATIVTSSVAQNKNGTKISGNTVKVVIVRTNPGYSPDPSGTGTGVVVAEIPC